MAEGGKIKVLYVDDEEINLLLFRMTLMDHFEIITTESPLDALNIFRKNEIRVVIADYKMPNMNGMELIRQIKALNPGTVCMILSGYLESDVATDKDLLHSYIMKPWKKGTIIEKIYQAISA